MNKYISIQTEIGTLRGRDCIYLDEVRIQDGQNTLVLIGVINGDLCSKQQLGVEIPYELKFTGVLALKMVELDSWDCVSESSFDEIKNSTWLQTLDGKVKSHHRHFLIQTYDEVFEVVCCRYEFKI